MSRTVTRACGTESGPGGPAAAAAAAAVAVSASQSVSLISASQSVNRAPGADSELVGVGRTICRTCSRQSRRLRLTRRRQSLAGQWV